MALTSTFEAAKKAVLDIQALSQEQINDTLLKLSARTAERCDEILAANKKDLEKMDENNPLYDRLKLTRERIYSIADDITNVASLPSPVGEVLSEVERPNGMLIKKIRVPFGVIGVIYEARPNVSFDVFSLCFKSANICILKGGSDAHNSNCAIVALIKDVLAENNINPDAVTLLPAEREATAELLNAKGYVDLLIPRGGKSLIKFVNENARIPVIETGAGICHTYFDKYGDLEKGRNIILNAKTRRVSVCNALDCLVIHSARLDSLAALCEPLAEKNVIIYADPQAHDALAGKYPKELLQKADENSFGPEFLDYKMAIKTIDSFNEALEHINKYTSQHSESIVTENEKHANIFTNKIDAACVYWNVSTAFTDGAQFGFGAEIGISTQKMHARGPMALPELTTYKYIITGNGQTRQ